MLDVARHKAWGFLVVPVAIVAAMLLAGGFAGQEPQAAPEKPVQEEKAAGDAKSGDEKPGTSKNKSGEEKTAEDKPKGDVPENPFPDRPMAPDFDGGHGWLNTSGEISIKDLRGKIVILDFWTYCCINCIHVLPDLKYLEEKYAKQIVVIGVHSAKFDNEKESGNIRKAIQRYEIAHPVVNDAEMKIWNKFGISAWPSLVLIDPEGRYLGQASGEGNRDLLDTLIPRIIAYHKAKGTLDETPVNFSLEKDPATPLRFPGKIVADKVDNRLFISDSNHNRIVIATLSGKLLDVIGTGQIGRKDGGYAEAQFDHPQGMCLVGQTLYVADTENHVLRAVDLKAKTVTTIAGTGEQSQDRSGGGKGTEQALNSPWDVTWVDGKLFVAMAGPHQLWVYNPADKTIGRYAGSGREDIRNGDLLSAAFAQPSGITTDGKHLYDVCSEGSAVRKISLSDNGEVTTLAGASDLPRGRSLFEFGDTDGTGDGARLQHPLGITFHKKLLYVCDSYNHKIKTVDPQTGETKTLLGDGEPGLRDEPARFSEPAGITAADNKLYVADTNNHVIRVVDLATNKVSTLAIEGLTPPVKPTTIEEDLTKPIAVAAQKVAPQKSGDKDALTVEVTLVLPEGYKLNKLAPPVYKLTAAGEQSLIAADQLNQRQEAPLGDANVVKLEVPLAARSGEVSLTLSMTYNYCRDGVGGLCKLSTVSWTIPVTLDEAATEKVVKISNTTEK